MRSWPATPPTPYASSSSALTTAAPLASANAVSKRWSEEQRAFGTAAQQADTGRSNGVQVSTDGYRERFIEAMDDDFGTSQALAALYDLARDINRGADSGSDVADAVAMLRELASVLGLTLEGQTAGSGADDKNLAELVKQVVSDLDAAGQTEIAGQLSGAVSGEGSGPDDYVKTLIDVREKLRKSREFALADQIRDSLTERGVALKDSPAGTTWEFV